MTAKKLILSLFPGLFLGLSLGLFWGLALSIVPALLPAYSQTLTGADPARQIEIKLRDIFFDSNRYSIRAVDESILEDVANILLKNSQLTIILEGYTDIKGEEDYNLELARRRTIAVKQHLLDLGVDPDAVISIYRGETTRFAEGSSEEALQLNRRVKFVPKEKPSKIPGASVFQPSVEFKAALKKEQSLSLAPLPETQEIEYALDSARSYVLRNIDTSHIEFTPPKDLRVGDKKVLTITMTKSFATDLARQLRLQLLRSFGGDPPPSSVDLELAGDNFEITRTVSSTSGGGDEEKNIWQWEISALEPGIQSLLMRVVLIVDLPESGIVQRGFPLIERVVDVRPNRFRSVGIFVLDYMGLFLGLAVLAALIIYFRKQ